MTRKTVKRVKTGSVERRFSMAKAGFMAGAKYATASAGTFFTSKDKREERRKEILSARAQELVEELGKLKGSVVKIGQMMALFGEHFLPEEVTTALHTLENQTTALEWSAIEKHLQRQLGEVKLAELEVDTRYTRLSESLTARSWSSRSSIPVLPMPLIPTCVRWSVC